MPIAAALPAIAVALTAVGAGVGTYAAVQQGNAAKAAGRNQQEAANASAKAANDAAALEAGQIRRKNLLRLGAQRASAAKSGILIDDSAGDVITDSAIQGELEALSAVYSGAATSSAHQRRGALARYEGNQAASAAYIGAGSTVIGGLGSSVNSYRAANPPAFRSSASSPD